MILISFYPKRSLKRTTASLQFDIGGAKLKHCIYCKIFCAAERDDNKTETFTQFYFKTSALKSKVIPKVKQMIS